MLNHIHNWRHAGEQDAVAIYVLGYPNYTLVVSTGLALLARQMLPDDSLWMIIGAIFLSYALLSRRRALILSHSLFAYRPFFGSLKPIAFADIISMKRQRTTFAGTFAVPGIRFDLKEYRIAAVPVDCAQGWEIYQQVRSLVGIPGSVNPTR